MEGASWLFCLRLLSSHLLCCDCQPWSSWVHCHFGQCSPLDSPSSESHLRTGKWSSVCSPLAQLPMGLGGRQQQRPFQILLMHKAWRFSAYFHLWSQELKPNSNYWAHVTVRSGGHCELIHTCFDSSWLLLLGEYNTAKKGKGVEFCVRCHSLYATGQPLGPSGSLSWLKPGGWAVAPFVPASWPVFLRVGAAPQGMGSSAVRMGVGTIVCVWHSPEPLQCYWHALFTTSPQKMVRKHSSS